MLNISFFQVIIVLFILFLLFGDFSKLKLNLNQFREFLSKIFPLIVGNLTYSLLIGGFGKCGAKYPVSYPSPNNPSNVFKCFTYLYIKINI